MNARTLTPLLVFVLALLLSFPVLARQAAEKPASESGIEEMSTENFAVLLKQAWSFLKDETERYVNQEGSRSEFERKSDFDQRLDAFKKQYVANVAKYIKDQKLDQRVFSLRFKAALAKYNVETEMYSIRSSQTIDAPYNIPTVQCAVAPNPFVALADSIRQGYRISSLYLNFKPSLSVRMSRDVAASAKSDEDGMYFQVHFQVNLDSSKDPSQAKLLLVPKRIMLMNTKAGKTYWERTL